MRIQAPFAQLISKKYYRCALTHMDQFFFNPEKDWIF